MCQELNRFTLDNEDSTTEVHNMDILGNLKKHNMDADHKDMENCANAAKAWVLKKANVQIGSLKPLAKNLIVFLLRFCETHPSSTQRLSSPCLSLSSSYMMF